MAKWLVWGSDGPGWNGRRPAAGADESPHSTQARCRLHRQVRRVAAATLKRPLAVACLKWSGRWESNPRLKLGKLGYYHYTTPAAPLVYATYRRYANKSCS